MTFGAIIGCSIITVCVLLLIGGCCFLADSEGKIIAIALLVGIIICGIMWGITAWYYNNTEEGKRAFKTQQSNFNGGITREVKVYDVEGDLIAEYKGKFDIEYDDDRILFDDENGNRHIIYYPTGNVIIDEIGGD